MEEALVRAGSLENNPNKISDLLENATKQVAELEKTLKDVRSDLAKAQTNAFLQDQATKTLQRQYEEAIEQSISANAVNHERADVAEADARNLCLATQGLNLAVEQHQDELKSLRGTNISLKNNHKEQIRVAQEECDAKLQKCHDESKAEQDRQAIKIADLQQKIEDVEREADARRQTDERQITSLEGRVQELEADNSRVRNESKGSKENGDSLRRDLSAVQKERDEKDSLLATAKSGSDQATADHARHLNTRESILSQYISSLHGIAIQQVDSTMIDNMAALLNASEAIDSSLEANLPMPRFNMIVASTPRVQSCLSHHTLAAIDIWATSKADSSITEFSPF